MEPFSCSRTGAAASHRQVAGLRQKPIAAKALIMIGNYPPAVTSHVSAWITRAQGAVGVGEYDSDISQPIKR